MNDAAYAARAESRAVAAGLRLLPLGEHRWAVEAESATGRYEVHAQQTVHGSTVLRCSCPAATRGRWRATQTPCKHAAAVWRLLEFAERARRRPSGRWEMTP